MSILHIFVTSVAPTVTDTTQSVSFINQSKKDLVLAKCLRIPSC